jgi:hypothetical protein
MKTNIRFLKSFHCVMDYYRVLKSAMISSFQVKNSHSNGYMKIPIFLLMLLSAMPFLNSCVGYIESEPSYVEIERPARPSVEHIWIDGGWRWDYRNHIYVQRPGYWVQSRQGRSYIKGHWEAGPKGKRWIDGHWQRERERDENDRHER